MIDDLISAARRFREEGKLPPTGFKPKNPKWIINLEGRNAYLEGPYDRNDLRAFPSPDRQRSGTPSQNNLKPYLLLDDARYVLGKPEAGKEEVAALLNGGFIELLQQAHAATGVEHFSSILDFLNSADTQRILEQVEPKDMVAFRVAGQDLTELPEVQKFWSDYLAKELVTKENAECSACGRQIPVLQTLPREVVVLGQKCQLSSFNRSAFTSFGKEQSTNASLCFDCASQAIDAIDYLIRSEQHHRTLWFDPEASSLENQLAIFWLDRHQDITVGAVTLDVEALLASVLEDHPRDGPPVDLSQIRAFLAVPWRADETAITLDATQLHLAILSANKGRLVVREWLNSTLGQVQSNLTRYLDSTRITSAWGDTARPLSIVSLLQAIEATNPNFARGLLRTAYLGHTPPQALWTAAVKDFRNLKILQHSKQDIEQAKRLHALASLIKLGLYFGKPEVYAMSELNPGYRSQAYLCGQLLAVLEEAQQASHFNKHRSRLDTTIVNRFYGLASTAPASAFGGLLRLGTTAHLPNVGKGINLLMEEVSSRLDEAGGFPNTLTLAEQAEFGLGFYHQRANIRAHRGKNKSTQGEQP